MLRQGQISEFGIGDLASGARSLADGRDAHSGRSGMCRSAELPCCPPELAEHRVSAAPTEVKSKKEFGRGGMRDCEAPQDGS